MSGVKLIPTKCHGLGFCINYIPYAQGIGGVSEPLCHSAMHARHPTAFAVSGPLFDLYTQWSRTCLSGARR